MKKMTNERERERERERGFLKQPKKESKFF